MEQKDQNADELEFDKVEIDIEKLRQKRLMIATPMYGGNCTAQYVKSLISLNNFFHQYGLDYEWSSLNNESLITRARNYSVDIFLQSKCTHLMFIDADIEFNPQDVLFLLHLCDEDTNKDVVCGGYAKKNISFEKLKEAVDKGFGDKNPQELENFTGDFVFSPLKAGTINLKKPAEVREAGTGFMMIKRSVFEKFADAHPEFSYNPDHKRSKDFDGSRSITAFFLDPLSHNKYFIEAFKKIKNLVYKRSGNSDISDDVASVIKEYDKLINEDGKRHLSEDYFFAEEVRRLGFKVWLCPWFQINHVGTYKFIGSLLHLAAIGAHTSVDESKITKS